MDESINKNSNSLLLPKIKPFLIPSAHRFQSSVVTKRKKNILFSVSSNYLLFFLFQHNQSRLLKSQKLNKIKKEDSLNIKYKIPIEKKDKYLERIFLHEKMQSEMIEKMRYNLENYKNYTINTNSNRSSVNNKIKENIKKIRLQKNIKNKKKLKLPKTITEDEYSLLGISKEPLREEFTSMVHFHKSKLHEEAKKKKSPEEEFIDKTIEIRKSAHINKTSNKKNISKSTSKLDKIENNDEIIKYRKRIAFRFRFIESAKKIRKAGISIKKLDEKMKKISKIKRSIPLFIRKLLNNKKEEYNIDNNYNINKGNNENVSQQTDMSISTSGDNRNSDYTNINLNKKKYNNIFENNKNNCRDNLMLNYKKSLFTKARDNENKTNESERNYESSARIENENINIEDNTERNKIEK